MAIEMKVPSVGESVTEVTIASWVKKDGDFVKMDEVICELESDKATFELPAESDGILRIVAKEGETLAIGAVICKISPSPSPVATVALTPSGGTLSSSEEVKKEEYKNTENIMSISNTETPSGGLGAVPIKVPAVGESISEVTIASWTKKDGDAIKMDEVICELESDKATFELPSPEAGILRIVVAAGTVQPIGAVIAQINPASSPLTPDGGTLSSSKESPSPSGKGGDGATPPSGAGGATPLAANILADKGIDVKSVQGSGTGGRVMKEDALKATPVPASTPAPEKKVEPTPAPAILTDGRATRREKMTSLRKTIARRLVAVKQETAMLTTFNEVDMKPIMDLRAKYKDKFKETHGVGLGFMSFFTKACAIALREFPVVNAYIDGEEIVYNDYADIAIAVSAPRGLVVPVIRSAEKMGFADIENEVVRLATRARENKLTIEEMTGGTFTITNGGIFGSMLSTPIINAPQSAILGMHNIVERAVVVNGEIVIRPIMYVALSYDHRTIDGKDSVSFLVRVKQLLEDPTRMLLGV
jgi:2-oxoglutarate dehydrogenase E2 component (dihydrolipoamide succinyltransferase)